MKDFKYYIRVLFYFNKQLKFYNDVLQIHFRLIEYNPQKETSIN